MTFTRKIFHKITLYTENEMTHELEHPNIQLATYPDSEIMIVTLLSVCVRETEVTVDTINK